MSCSVVSTCMTVLSLPAVLLSWYSMSPIGRIEVGALALLRIYLKPRFTAVSPVACSRLSVETPDPSQVRTSFEVLGCSARVGPRQKSKTESQRLEAARQTVLLLGNLRWPFERFWQVCRSHALSKCLFQKDTWRFWAAVRRALRVHQHANKFLRAIIFGGNGHLDCVSGTNLTRIVMKLKRPWLLHWQDRKNPGHPLWTLNTGCERHDYYADHRPFQCGLLTIIRSPSTFVNNL